MSVAHSQPFSACQTVPLGNTPVESTLSQHSAAPLTGAQVVVEEMCRRNNLFYGLGVGLGKVLGTRSEGTLPDSFDRPLRVRVKPSRLSQAVSWVKGAVSDTVNLFRSKFLPAVSAPPEVHEIILLSYNIDTNAVRAEEGYARDAFPEWRASERTPYLIDNLRDIIRADHPDIIQLQETRKFVTKFGDQVDSVTKLVEFLESEGYTVLVEPYNQTGDKAFKFVSAFDPKRFSLADSRIKYLTKTPNQPTPRPSTEGKSAEEVKKILSDIREHNLGAEWERVVFELELENRATGDKVYSLNVHLDISVETRLKSTELLVQFVQAIVKSDPKAKVVISGDFNTIPGWGDGEQLNILHQATVNDKPLLQEATQDIQ